MNREGKRITVKDMVLTGVMTAALAVLSQIAIPLPSGVPITLQVFAVALMGVVLGISNGMISLGIYILLGTIGVPVFSNFRSGIYCLLGPTGGFIFGFFLLSLFCSLSAKTKGFAAAGLCAAGLILCHIIGCIQFSVVTKTELWQSVLAVNLPYILKDAVLVSAAYFVGRRMKELLDRIM